MGALNVLQITETEEEVGVEVPWWKSLRFRSIQINKLQPRLMQTIDPSEPVERVSTHHEVQESVHMRCVIIVVEQKRRREAFQVGLALLQSKAKYW